MFEVIVQKKKRFILINPQEKTREISSGINYADF